MKCFNQCVGQDGNRVEFAQELRPSELKSYPRGKTYKTAERKSCGRGGNIRSNRICRMFGRACENRCTRLCMAAFWQYGAMRNIWRELTNWALNPSIWWW